MRLFIERARLYANVNDSRSSKFAMKVEAVSSSSGLDSSEEKAIRNGDRKYLATAKARDNLEILLAQLESEIEDLDDDDRMPFALREIGYSDDGRRRIEEQHLKHRSANMLMTLFEAISCADEELDGTYRLEGQVIFLCLDQKHAALGEILLSCIGQAYVQTGRGFNGTHAGKSVASSKKYGDEWVDWQQEAVDEGLIASNLAAEKARIAAYRDRQQSLIAEIEAGNEEGTKFVLGDLVLARQIGDLYGSLEQQLANLQI